MKKLLKWICQQKGAVYQEETIDFPMKGPNYVSTMINQIQLNNKKKNQNPELDFLVAIANLKFHYRTSAFPVWLIDVLSFVHDRCTGNISLKSALLCVHIKVIDLVKTTLQPGTKLAVFDHIPSNAPFILPVEELSKICQDRYSTCSNFRFRVYFVCLSLIKSNLSTITKT